MRLRVGAVQVFALFGLAINCTGPDGAVATTTEPRVTPALTTTPVTESGPKYNALSQEDRG